MHTTNQVNKRGIDAGQWPYLVAMVLGLFALAFFAWIAFRSATSDRSIFDTLGNVFGLPICLLRIVKLTLEQ